jgi:ribosomal protein S18 acetylase RimI-like enzyme
MHVRPYQAGDMARCLIVFDSNTPRYFHASERVLFERFLRQPYGVFLVIEDDPGSLVACGGYDIDAQAATGILTWGMVIRDYHGRGFGTALALARLSRLVDTPGIERIIIDTSQYANEFFESFGFVTQQITEGGFAPGLHKYDMVLPLNSATRQAIRARWAALTAAHS